MIIPYSVRDPGLQNFDLQIDPLAPHDGAAPSNAAYASLLRQCADSRTLAEGKRIHSDIAAHGRDRDTFLANLLVHMYGKCGDVISARRAFDQAEHRNVFSWNMMIGAFAHNGYGSEGVKIFRAMALEGEPPNLVTFLNAVLACSWLGDLAEARRMHDRIVAAGYGSHRLLSTSLISMYGKCRSIEDARALFDRIAEKNAFSWNAMIAACVHAGRSDDAIALFRAMESSAGVELDYVTYITMITACASSRNLGEGERAHGKIVAAGLHSLVDVANALVNLYGKCGRIDRARRVFDAIESKNLGSWNAIIAAYAHNGHGARALALYRDMDLKGIKLDRIAFTSVIRACSSIGNLAQARSIHASVVSRGYGSERVVGTALVDMYAKCGDVAAARAVFDGIRDRDVICWTAMVASYAQSGDATRALEIYRGMDCKPGKMTVTSVLAACAAAGALEEGKAIHAEIAARRLEIDVAVGNALVNLYGRCGSWDLAREVFDAMPERDLITWNTMIGLCARAGSGKESLAMDLYREMIDAGAIQPNEVTFLSVLQACAETGKLDDGRLIHAHLLRRKIKADLVATALFNMYSKCGCLADCRGVFQDLCVRDVVSWTAMIAAYARHGHGRESLLAFREMILDGVLPNQITLVNVLHACNHSGFLEEGLEIFADAIREDRFAPTREIYGCVIDLAARAGWVEEAEALIDRMPFEVDPVALTSLLGGCRAVLDVDRAERVVGRLSEMEPGNSTPCLILGRIYAATGHWDRLKILEKTMEERGAQIPTENFPAHI